MFEEARSEQLKGVKYSVVGTRLRKEIIDFFLEGLENSRTVGGLHSRLGYAIDQMKTRGLVFTANTVVTAGEAIDTAEVILELVDHPLLTWEAELCSGFGEFGLSLRNLRGKSDATRLRVGYDPNTGDRKTWVGHFDPWAFEDRWQAGFGLSAASKEVDQSIGYDITEIGVKQVTGSHTFTQAVQQRVANVNPEMASDELIPSEILPTTILGLGWQWSGGNLVKEGQNLIGRKLDLSALLGLGDRSFLQAQINWTRYYPVLPAFSLQLYVKAAGVMGNTSAVDRVYSHYIPGFTSIGNRSGEGVGKYGVEGNDLGSSSAVQAAVRLHYHAAPILTHLSVIPFAHSSFYFLSPFSPNRRVVGSLGVGLGWTTPFGRLELLANPFYMFTQPSDVPSKFQVLISN